MEDRKMSKWELGWEKRQEKFREELKLEEEQQMNRETRINEKREKRELIEYRKKDIILMLDVHRRFANSCLFGDKIPSLYNCVTFGVVCIEEFYSDNLQKKDYMKLIDFTTFVRFMRTDGMINSYCEDVRVSNFAMILSDNGEYYRQDLEWNISMIDIEILFDVLRENQFIASDTPRSIFFEIFNPHLSVFNKPVVWKDIKELAYFLDKCKEYSLFENYKYQNIVEKYRMFKTNHSKGDFVKSNSLRTTLSDVKDEFGNYSEDKEFLKRVEFLEEMFDGMDCCSNKILTEEDDD
jgi:hypothetical protein